MRVADRASDGTITGWFGPVAQRRRRVFLVINTRDWRRAAAVLFEPESVSGNTTSSKEKRQALAADARSGPAGSGGGLAFAQNQHDKVRLIGGDGSISGALAAQRWGNYKNETLVAEPNDCLTPWDVQSKRVFTEGGCAPTLPSVGTEGMTIQPIVMASDHSHAEIGEGGHANSDCAHAEGRACTSNGEDVFPSLCATDGSKQFIDNQSVSGGRLLLDPKRGSTVHCISSNGEDVIGALCARDYKGVGTQFVGEGKVIVCKTDQ